PVWTLPQTTGPVPPGVLDSVALPFGAGRKPPWNQPHVTRFSLSRSPTFLPAIVTYVRVFGAGFDGSVQLSSAGPGRGSPMMVRGLDAVGVGSVTFPVGFPRLPNESATIVAPHV